MTFSATFNRDNLEQLGSKSCTGPSTGEVERNTDCVFMSFEKLLVQEVIYEDFRIYRVLMLYTHFFIFFSFGL